jgi:hypothetical protein
MSVHPTLVLYDRNDQKVATVEVKNKRGTSRQWAAEFRRNLADYGLLRGSEFFLLATPDRLYLWKESGKPSSLILPDYEADGASVLERYIRKAGLNPDGFSSNAFELIVANWLSFLALEIETPSSQDWLVQSGLLDAIRMGRIEHQEAA